MFNSCPYLISPYFSSIISIFSQISVPDIHIFPLRFPVVGPLRHRHLRPGRQRRVTPQPRVLELPGVEMWGKVLEPPGEKWKKYGMMGLM